MVIEDLNLDEREGAFGMGNKFADAVPWRVSTTRRDELVKVSSKIS